MAKSKFIATTEEYPSTRRVRRAGYRRNCCDGRCWTVIAIFTIGLLLLALACIGGLLELLRRARRPIEFVEDVHSCTGCSTCYSCLADHTAQPIDKICDVKDLNIMAQCTSQTQYIYSQENVNDSIPCYASCRRCRDCLDDLKLGTLRLNILFWQTVYSDYFEDMTEIDQERDCKIECTTSLECAWICNNTTDVASQKKRQVVSDGDACCPTTKQTLPYLTQYVDGNGVTWYPVWFYKSWASPPYSYQLYDDVTCPISNSLCDSALQCRAENGVTTMLMSTTAPDPVSGYTYIYLVYPSTTVKFIDLDLPCYCRCTN